MILATLAAEAGLDARIGPFVGFYVLILAIVGPILAARSRHLEPVAPERPVRHDRRGRCRATVRTQHSEGTRERWTSTAACDSSARTTTAILATRRRDGSPADVAGRRRCRRTDEVVISTRETAIKAKNLRRDPQASVCVFGDAFYGQWVQIDGTAEVVSLPEAMEALVDYYRSSPASTPTGTTTAPRCSASGGCLVRITVTCAGPDMSG